MRRQEIRSCRLKPSNVTSKSAELFFPQIMLFLGGTTNLQKQSFDFSFEICPNKYFETLGVIHVDENRIVPPSVQGRNFLLFCPMKSPFLLFEADVLFTLYMMAMCRRKGWACKSLLTFLSCIHTKYEAPLK